MSRAIDLVQLEGIILASGTRKQLLPGVLPNVIALILDVLIELWIVACLKDGK